MAPILYMVPASPPVRAVQMTAKSIGLNLELKQLDLAKDEHKTPEFLMLNPQHTIPTLVDDGYVLWDSHAIMSYLLTKYGKDDNLCPKDPKQKGVVHQRLHFESGEKTVDQEDLEIVEENYAFVEAFLEGRQWIAGDSVTIADYSLIASITSPDVIHKIDPIKYPKVTAWLKRAKTLPVYDVKGLDAFASFIKSFLG